MADEIRFVARVERESQAREIALDVNLDGGTASVEVPEGQGFAPVAVWLVVLIPPGLALLANTINGIVHTWKDKGTLIDARGTGDPKVVGGNDLKPGTIVILTNDGDKATRTDLPSESVGDYTAKVLKALTDGASATEAKIAADGD